MPSLTDLASRFGGEVVGNGNIAIGSVASLSEAQAGQLAFYESSLPRQVLLESKAAAVLLKKEAAADCPLPMWVVSKPRLYFAQVAKALNAKPAQFAASITGISSKAFVADGADIHESATIAPLAVVEAGAKIAADVFIGGNAVIGGNAIVGEGSAILPGAVLYPNVVVGKRCIIHAGAILGSDGFGFVADEKGRQVKIPQLGGLILGDDVEIGANSAIDRGALTETKIGDGVKIDNLVQIAHNVHIGDNTVICGCTGIAGSTVIGENCMIGGAVRILGHIVVGDNVMITFSSNITKNIPAGTSVSSCMPAMPIARWRRFVAGLRRLTLQ